VNFTAHMQVEIICTFERSVGVVSLPLDEEMKYLFVSLTDVKGGLNASFVNLHLACREDGQDNLHIAYTMHSSAGGKRWHRRLVSAQNIQLDTVQSILQKLQHLEFSVHDQIQWKNVHMNTRVHRVYLTTSEDEEGTLCDLLGMYESDTESEDEDEEKHREQWRSVLKGKLKTKMLESQSCEVGDARGT